MRSVNGQYPLKLDLYSRLLHNISDDVYDEEPVDLETFLYSLEYLNIHLHISNEYDLSQKQLNFLYAMDDINPNTNKYTEAVLQFGKGSGKDLIVAILFCRHVYLLLCFHSPQAHLKCTFIDFLNVAYTAPQAKDIFFRYLKDLVKKAGPKAFVQFGFKPYSSKHNGHIFESKIEFPKQITLISGHSDQEALEGKNLYMAVMDEAAAFKAKSELKQSKERHKQSADAIYKMLKTSLRSRHARIGKLILISYPRYKKDFIQQKYDEGVNREDVYTDFASTYEVNPKVAREDLQIDYDFDNETAMAMYDCIPPASINPFLGVQNIKKAYDIAKQPTIITPFDDNGILVKDFMPIYDKQYVVGVDTSLSNDPSALAMGYVDKIENGRPFVKIVLMEVIYPPKDGTQIQLDWVRERIFELSGKGFRIIHVYYDQYQSADQIQILTRNGYKASLYSVDRNMEGYLALKSLIAEGRIDFYYHEVLLKELSALTLINNKKVEHPDPGSKDLSDCFARIAGNLAKTKYFENKTHHTSNYTAKTSSYRRPSAISKLTKPRSHSRF